MTSALYLEHYLDSLEHLPVELQRNFSLMRDLDSRAQMLMKNIDSLCTNYLKSFKTLTSEAKKEQMVTIQNLFSKAKEYGDDKVQLAIQTYELVDKHIRRLDSDLARFESEIQDKALNSRPVEELPSTKNRKKKPDLKKKQASSDEDSSSTTKSLKKKLKKSGQASSSSVNKSSNLSNILEETKTSVLPSLSANLHGTDVLDMPVDPNEPTYCLCHQVSYGEMIGCDNSECPIEWFHFACVGLVTKPKGKWYCPKCIVDRKKK